MLTHSFGEKSLYHLKFKLLEKASSTDRAAIIETLITPR